MLQFSIQLFLLIGDININLKCKNTSREYTNLLYSYKFTNGNTDDTRVTYHSSTLIDHVYYRKDINYETQTQSGNTLTAITDHILIYFSLNTHISQFKNTTNYHSNLNSGIKQNIFINSIKSATFPNTTNKVDIDFFQFVKVITTNFYKHFPLVPCNTRKSTNPWITLKHITDIKHKQTLFKIFLKRPTFLNEFIYKEHRKLLRQNINYAKSMYYKSQFTNKCKTSKEKWRLLNQIITQPKQQHDIKLHFAETVTTNLTQSDIMNNYFANICTSNHTNIQYEYHCYDVNKKCFILH